ncbi:MAG: cell envelope integrity protein CreD [Marinicaulis sp.]|nr:cell envelope integrity protein CreD [Marinicaulis sp.]
MQQRAASARSAGLKLILVGCLAFVLWIPAMLVCTLVWDRSSRADQVTAEIFQTVGGRQNINGPIILVPVVIDTGETDKKGAAIKRSTAVAYTPRALEIDAKVDTETRKRSIFDATIYSADIQLSGKFDPLQAPKLSLGNVEMNWGQAILVIGFGNTSDLKGLRDDPALSVNGRRATARFEPVNDLPAALGDNGAYSVHMAGVGIPMPINPSRNGFSFDLNLKLAGGGSLFFSPVGEETTLVMSADWPAPGFQGEYLPTNHDITDAGFNAQWRVPYLARNLPRSFFIDGNLGGRLSVNSFGVEFVATKSPYKSVNRALKYALMFIGVVLLTFFLIEAIIGVRAHPAQYILLGAAQVIFYLMTLALAEQIGFDKAFLITAAATVTLSGFYAASVFGRRLYGFVAFSAFSSAYGLIYLLMKAEDYALLIGSTTAFAAIALTMYITRNLDWYGVAAPAAVNKETS